MQKTSRLAHSILAAVPLLVTPGLIYVLAEGWLDFGGGEKDILLALPYMLWALVFFSVSLLLIIRHWPLRKWLARAGLVSVLVVLGLWGVAFFASMLGFV